ncbi:serine hydrolase domain-containing protein [Vacuolonema iberomarrocanum]|uniref:serine hydrolase domain-containing protein n=1 Tax=Vacuolonema iberomarrocanum TaxID=3454632 RepID=UPI0019ECA5D9|nr:beta-lactamase family protein [filamentous cyanobacterium LEGE 07170]
MTTAIATTSLKTEIETLIKPWIAKKAHINLVIGIVQGNKRWVQGWGPSDMAALTGAAPQPVGEAIAHPDGNTLFEIGSLTKVFTASLLSLLVERQQLQLTTPLNQLGHPYQALPDTVTLESLATHTSGLPRLPDNMKSAYEKDPQNPYAAYSFADLHDYLQNHNGRPTKTTGMISYSNLGAGVLGNILAAQLGQSYEEAVIDQICNALKLSDTRVTLNPEQKIRLAMGYLEDGKPTPYWDLPALAGAGALRSTAHDLLTFITAHMRPEQTPIAQALSNTHPLRYKTLAPAPGLLGLLGWVAGGARRLRGAILVRTVFQGVGLGWFIDYLPSIEHRVYTHTGGTGGHRSFFGFIPETQTGVVVLSNYGEILSTMFGQYSTGSVGLKILEMLHQADQPGDAKLSLPL